jgi:hypothetical protein
LIGRDIPEIHHVHEQILGDKGKPFAQKLPLGWVIIGEVCLGKVHAPTEISVRKTSAQRQRQELQPQVSHLE